MSFLYHTTSCGLHSLMYESHTLICVPEFSVCMHILSSGHAHFCFCARNVHLQFVGSMQLATLRMNCTLCNIFSRCVLCHKALFKSCRTNFRAFWMGTSISTLKSWKVFFYTFTGSTFTAVVVSTLHHMCLSHLWCACVEKARWEYICFSWLLCTLHLVNIHIINVVGFIITAAPGAICY